MAFRVLRAARSCRFAFPPPVLATALVLAVVIFPSLVAKSAAAEPRTVTDAHGREVTIGAAERIVSIGGAVTETLYALGLGDHVVGIDLTSTYPVEARDKPIVGYMRALSAEGVLSLAPDLVVAIEGSGPPDAIAVLERASVPFVLVPDGHDGPSAVEKIRFIARVVGAGEKGEAIAEALAADLVALAPFRTALDERRKAIFVLGASSGSPLAAGRDTSADGIFALAGIDNALTGFSGFKPTSDEAAMASDPDAVVIMSERSHELAPETIFAMPAFADTPAARTGTLIALPAGYLLNFGPRTAHAARDLAAALYPEHAIPELPARPWVGGEEGGAE